MERHTQKGYIYHDCDFMDSGLAADMNHLSAYEDTGLEPGEVTAALESAAKLIATMRNNKKAALWLKRYRAEEMP